MKKPIFFKVLVGIMAFFINANSSYAQEGIGTNKPNKASVLDLTSTSKGMLFPRVALINTTSFQPISGIENSLLHTAHSLIVFNTASSGIGETAVKPGFYYWDKKSASVAGKWVRMVSSADINDLDLQGDVKGPLFDNKVVKLQNVPISSNRPLNGEVLQFNGVNWVPTAVVAPTVTSANNGLTLNGTVVQLGGNLNKSTIINQNNNNFTLQTGGSNLNITGLDKLTVQNQPDYLLSITEENAVKAVKAALPKFFYMPPIMLPLMQDQIIRSMHATFSNNQFRVDLYKIYEEQFGGTNSVNSTSNPSKTTTLPILPKNELDYYITYYDETVYTNVQVSNDGILTYRIATNADPNDGSFMNIVFAVKP